MKIDILTIFPEFFRGPLDFGIVRKAREAGLAAIEVHDLRAFAHDRHRTVDDRPFGGGEGMVLSRSQSLNVLKAWSWKAAQNALLARGNRASCCCRRKAAASIRVWRKTRRTGTDCADLRRYEGVDERVGQHLADRELSIGDYVLSGGELGAAVIVDAVTRLIPGALGNEASTRQESFTAGTEMTAGDGPDSTCSSGGLLDYLTTRGPPTFAAGRFPKYWFRAITRKYAVGGDAPRWRRRCATGPICWIATG